MTPEGRFSRVIRRRDHRSDAGPQSTLSALPLLQTVAFVCTLDRFATAPMLVAIAADLNSTLAAVVGAASAYFLVYGLAQPVWGLLADRFGRVRTIRTTLLLAGLLGTASALSGSAVVLAITRGLTGGFFGAAYPSCLVYIGDTVPARERQRSVARLMVGVAMGTAVASCLAGIVSDHSSWRLVFLATGVGALILCWFLRSLPEPYSERPRTRPSTSFRLISRSGATLLVLALAFAEGAVLVGVLTLVPVAAHHSGASVSLAGLATAFYGLAVLIGTVIVGRLASAWHPWRLIAAGGALAVVACACLAVTQEVWMAATVAFLLGLAWTPLHTSLQTWATEVLPDERALVVSCFAGCLFAGSSVAALALGGAADAGRFTVVFSGAAVLAAVLTAVAATSRRRWMSPLVVGQRAAPSSPSPAPES